MKVLKKGRKQKGYAKERTCTGNGNGGGGCSAKLLVEEGDLFQTSHTDMKRETDYYVTFKCPECGVLTDLERPTSKEEEIAAKNGRIGTFGGRDDT